MALHLPRLVIRRLTNFGLAIILVLCLVWFLTPGDNVVLLAIRFNIGRLLGLARGSGPSRDAWLWKPALYPVERQDVGLLIKTGYGTRHRVPSQLEALGLSPSDDGQAFVVVGDFTPVNLTETDVTIHDAVGGLMKDPAMTRLDNYPRFAKYRHLQEAIQEGHELRALEIGKSFGWELDALKFIWGLELAFTKLPLKKWYLILDDDTFLIQPSLKLILTHLDSRQAHYIGNAVGDFKGRFAHGGSAVILSGTTVKRLIEKPELVRQARLLSLTETWGDKLIATTLQKLSIYLDERYSHFFNGESPTITKIRADRFCSPLLSFHGLSDPEEMRQIGLAFKERDKPTVWHQVWDLYGAPDMKSFAKNPAREQQDFVGRVDEATLTIPEVTTAEECHAQCEKQSSRCMAWTWESAKEACHVAPWMIIGGKPEGKMSGINYKRVQGMTRECGI